MTARFLDRLLRWLELWHATRFARRAAHDNLSFDGAGKVSVRVEDIIASPKVQQDVAAVREMQAQQRSERAGSSLCTAKRCRLQYWHSPCYYQTALADKRAKRRHTIRQRRELRAVR